MIVTFGHDSRTVQRCSNHAGYCLFPALERGVWRLQTVGLNASNDGFGGSKLGGGCSDDL